MLILRPIELRDLDDGSLMKALVDAHEEMFNLRFQNVTGQLDSRACARAGGVRTRSAVGIGPPDTEDAA